jgi:sugar lactone lactonase YvrE
MKRFVMLMLIAILAIGAVMAQDDDMGEDDMMLPDVIEFSRTGVLPEGVEWDAARERFLVGSLSEGTIFEINDMGEITPFIEDEDLISSVGIHIDAENDRLWVANSDRAVFSGMAEEPNISVAGYDLETGERLLLVDLGEFFDSPMQFVNDLTVDAEGNVYITNSFAPLIYQVTPEGEASVFVEDERWAVEGFGLNGIVYHPDGYLLVTATGTQELYKVPFDEEGEITQVELDPAFGGDGMVLTEDLELVVVGRAETMSGQDIMIYTSEDDWATATAEGFYMTEGAATTIAIRGGAFYYVNAYLNSPGQETYELVKVTAEDIREGDMMDMGEDEMADPVATEEADG